MNITIGLQVVTLPLSPLSRCHAQAASRNRQYGRLQSNFTRALAAFNSGVYIMTQSTVLKQFFEMIKKSYARFLTRVVNKDWRYHKSSKVKHFR